MSVTRPPMGGFKQSEAERGGLFGGVLKPEKPKARASDPKPGETPAHAGRFAIADALRATAILVVVLSHLATLTVPVVLGTEYHLRFLGLWGVAAFFVLSGYLLSGPYVRAALAGSRALPSTRLFLARRFLRIVPLYLVAVVISVAIDLIFRSEPVALGNVTAHLFMLQDFFDGYVQTLNSPLWTMPVDFEFYLVLPLAAFVACVVCARFQAAKRPALCIGILALITTGSLEYRLFAFKLLDLSAQSYFTIMSNLLGMAVIFALGVALTLVFELRKGRLLRVPVAVVCLAASVAAFASLPAASAYPSLGSVVAGASVFLALFALPSFPIFERIAHTPTVTFVAALAYATYLIHYPALRAATVLLPHHTGALAFFELILIALLTVLPAAYVLHRFVESPFLRMKDRQR